MKKHNKRRRRAHMSATEVHLLETLSCKSRLPTRGHVVIAIQWWCTLLAIYWLSLRKVYSERLAHPGRYSRGFAPQIRRSASMSTILGPP